MEFNSIHHLFSTLSFLCSHPLFSTIVTLYTLILLYIPSFFLSIALSPVLNSTGIILVSLLRSGANKLEKESKLSDTDDNEKLEKESISLESRVLDCKDTHSNLIRYSSFAQESKYKESRFLEFVTQNQNHAEFKPNSGLEFECNETHVEFEHDIGLESNSMESSHVIEEGEQTYEPNSGLVLECNQTHVEFEHDIGLESTSKELSQLIEEGAPTYEPKSGLDLECNQTHVEFEQNMTLESNSMESPKAIEGGTEMEIDTKQVEFLEWNMRAPLEIIYEAYEGEEDDDEESNENREVSNDKQDLGYERYPSLLMYYPDSETDSSLDGDFPMNEKWETHESVFFKWEDEEEEREELIEISLDHYGKRSIEVCHVDEDNLIEIDLFSTRN